ncbi:MAG TPA: cytochrome P450 [Solirubrobacteraceae bacterium]|nr:cytochrome P450 [Solirubrobacteraceae bacterium]
MDAQPAPRMPPGPRLPRLVQTLMFVLCAERYLRWVNRRYGGAVTLRTMFDDRFVYVFDPALVRQLFQGPHERLNAGEANEILSPVLGAHSVLLLDGAAHLRHRRLLLPPFHGRALKDYEAAILAATDAEIDGWPAGQPFALHPSMQALTLRVILQVVFGYAPAEAGELQARLLAFIEPLAERLTLRTLLTALRSRLGVSQKRLRTFGERKRAVDELLFAEIERRRALTDEELRARGDVFSMLLLARDESGEALNDQEIRDELLTLLLAGHETTANGLAWAFDLLLHNPSTLARARFGSDTYLDATAKEALRLRPVIPLVGRVVRGAPFRLGEWVIPEGIEINPSIRLIHQRGDLYPDPSAFRPERFLGADAPDTYTWIPFGGGTRRCLGAAFAQLEMRVVLRRVLERASLRPASPRLEQTELRLITLSPRNGTQVVMYRAPEPLSD